MRIDIPLHSLSERNKCSNFHFTSGLEAQTKQRLNDCSYGPFLNDLNLEGQFPMPREAEISLNERNFVLQALRENTRIDGRAFDAFRSIELSFGDEYGIADVKLGKTR